MKVRLPRIVQDPLIAAQEGLRPERFQVEDPEEVFLDGPVTSRLAVIDFDGDALHPVVRFEPPGRHRTLGRYAIDESDSESREFNNVSVFATVLETMRMFEEPGALGRKLLWAFGAPQLLVVPRAGRGTRAFYQRESHSLQFYFFPSQRPEHAGKDVFTSLSQDIVAHEAAHAILDSIAPDLYHAATPQSLGLHEAIADLTALLMAFRSRVLREAVLENTGGSIRESRLFSSLAEEYARSQEHLKRLGFLRSLDNRKTLDPNADPEDRVDRLSPHGLSQVLTGAFYPLVIELFEKQQREMAPTVGSAFSTSGKSLWLAAKRFQRMLLRALDYLPPGEVSFADYGRAVLASDQASYPDDEAVRRRIREEFFRRRIVEREEELDVRTGYDHHAVEDLRFETLLGSDWAAYDFANRHRRLLRIPEGIPFKVRPRIDATKTYYGSSGERQVRELIFKVSWDRHERNQPSGLPAQRRITVGTTLAVDWHSRQIRALLSSDHESEEEVADRDGLVMRMWEGDELEVTECTPESRRRAPCGAGIESTEGLMRLRRTMTLLHNDGGHGVARNESKDASQRLTPPSGVDTGAFFNLVRWRSQRP